MVLSDVDIKNYIQSGDISIEPFSEKRLKPGSYVLTLGKTLLKPTASNQVIDVDKPDVKYETVEMTDEGYVMQPGEFLLGQTAEKISISTKLCSVMDARGTLTRLGISMLQASTFTEPGQKESNEVLEISNIGPNPVRLYTGMKAVKIIFMKLETPANQDYSEVGAYSGQSSAHVVPN